MKKRIFILAAALLALSFIAAPSAAAQNKIVIYTSMYENVVNSLRAPLARAFPDIQIEFVYGGSGLLQAKIALEEAEKRLGCDMLLLADPSYAIELKGKGMLHSFQSSEAANLAFEYDRDGYWYPVRVSNMVLVYNPARFGRDAVPTSFQAFANDSRARSMISLGSPHTSGTVLATMSAMRDKYGDAYFTALGRQQLQINMLSSMAFDRLDSGQYRSIMILEESALQRQRQNPSRVQIIYPEDGTVMITSPVMIIANSWSANRNTAAAERIANWFLGVEGQNAIVDGNMHSVRTNFPRYPEGSRSTSEIRANSLPVNWQNIYSQRDDIRLKFDEALAMRVR